MGVESQKLLIVVGMRVVPEHLLVVHVVNVVQCGSVWFSVVQRGAAWCSVVQCGTG